MEKDKFPEIEITVENELTLESIIIIALLHKLNVKDGDSFTLKGVEIYNTKGLQIAKKEDSLVLTPHYFIGVEKGKQDGDSS